MIAARAYREVVRERVPDDDVVYDKTPFPLGRVVITPRTLGALIESDVLNALRSHVRGDSPLRLRD